MLLLQPCEAKFVQRYASLIFVKRSEDFLEASSDAARVFLWQQRRSEFSCDGWPRDSASAYHDDERASHGVEQRRDGFGLARDLSAESLEAIADLCRFASLNGEAVQAIESLRDARAVGRVRFQDADDAAASGGEAVRRVSVVHRSWEFENVEPHRGPQRLHAGRSHCSGCSDRPRNHVRSEKAVKLGSHPGAVLEEHPRWWHQELVGVGHALGVRQGSQLGRR
jgi:hypothetical protein